MFSNFEAEGKKIPLTPRYAPAKGIAIRLWNKSFFVPLAAPEKEKGGRKEKYTGGRRTKHTFQRKGSSKNLPRLDAPWQSFFFLSQHIEGSIYMYFFIIASFFFLSLVDESFYSLVHSKHRNSINPFICYVRTNFILLRQRTPLCPPLVKHFVATFIKISLSISPPMCVCTRKINNMRIKWLNQNFTFDFFGYTRIITTSLSH